jgi:hypothetical protein
VADDTFVIEDVERRRALEVPLAGDGAEAASSVAGVRERAPGQLLLVDRLFELVRLVLVGVDADEGKRLVFQLLDERPLVGP